ncbi:MAG: hypothetical protein ACRDGR_02350 [bacterium]
MRRSISAGILLGAAGLLSAAPPVLAAEVPPSAYANSVLAPVELLDDDNLVFLFPQHGMALPGQIQATVGSSFGVPGVGVTGRFGSQAAMLLASDHDSVHRVQAMTLAQAAWAAGGTRWRVGLAVRGSRAGDTTDRQVMEGEDVTRVDTSESVVRYSEVALGWSWRGERAFLDVVGEIFREDAELSAFDSSSSDTSAFAAATNPNVRGRGAVRFSVPVSSRTELRGWGSYRQLSNSLEVVRLAGPVPDTARADHYGHEWSVALAVVHASEAGLTRAYARYANLRSPEVPNESFGDASLVRRKFDVVEGGFSLEQPIWWELRFLAGFRSAFALTELLSTSTRSFNNSVERQGDTGEILSQAFSWGLHRTIRMLDLTASLRTDLALTDLFVTLDAKVRFP